MLYKYCRPERIDVLKEAQIALSRPRTFNDPFELSPHLTKFTNVPDMMLEVLSRTDDYVVLSLTEVPTSLLMWAHYTDGYQGFVIGFSDVDEILETPSDKRLSGPVFYCHHRPSHDRFKDVPDHELFYTKSTAWAYEREWRIIDSLTASKGPAFDEDFDCWPFSIRTEAVRQVIVGYRGALFIPTFMSILNEPRYKHVELFIAHPNERTFDLNLSPFPRDKWVDAS